ncbi:MAG: hypothetical protein A3J74_00225 [Elusimicrobia bacterium RIFCSPHIGHO2_02_FULL_57_9]|nr:MAG: hypothetical protein A3J74_00225 [Elusimicrobia bacterium RIFCSPHIGHO2_02_FULL_57_9]
MTPGSAIARLETKPLNVPLNEPFAIATGTKSQANNVLIQLVLANGITGYGEGAPPADSTQEAQDEILAVLKRQAKSFIGRDILALRTLLEAIDEKFNARQGCARAALGMAAADAWARSRKLPLRLLFGGAQTRIFSDVTVTIMEPSRAQKAARKILGMGIRTIKIKVGKDVAEDFERIRAVASLSKGLRLIVDANQGYGPRESLKLLRQLKKHGIKPALFEQPAAKDDWGGLKDVHRLGKISVAADESVSNRKEALKMARLKAAQVVNIKLMKCGLLEAWDIALICRAAGLGLMIGGMVESPLAMACSAHFAAGLGGFDFVDLDTPLWFKRNPMRGVSIGRGGVYDLARVSAGIGVTPRGVKWV